MSKTSTKLAALALALLTGCRAEPEQPQFPEPGRDVAPIVSDRFSTEDARDRLGEAAQVIAFAGIRPGMSIADVGAGEGYYTVRLAPAVGPKGRVLAEDIDPEVRDSLTDRVTRDNLDNVAVKLGAPDNPMLPAESFDRVLLVHMYHEVTSPYAFLWHLREGVKADGEIIVVDSARPVKAHGIPLDQLQCEFAALGLRSVRHQRLEGSDAYMVAFRIAAPRPAPHEIKRCSQEG